MSNNEQMLQRSYRWGTFIASVFTLSWFFAGWRQVNENGQLLDWALLFAGSFSTLALIFVQGYWIYFEEKAKGKLTKRIEIYEKIALILEHARIVKCPKKQVDIAIDKNLSSKERKGE